MSQVLTQEGRFKARPRAWAVEENSNTGTLQFACVFDIVAALNGDAWDDWAQYALEKTGYVYLSKRDGSPNKAGIRMLREALGWDGLNLEVLQNSDWSKTVVQITTEFEEYEGERRLRIRYINPENWDGLVVTPLDPAALKSLAGKWGAKFRAVTPRSGTKPAAPTPTPAKAALAPAKPTTPVPPPPVQPTATAPRVATRESAWQQVLEVCEVNGQSATEVWPALLAKLLPGKSEGSFTAADWAAVEVGAAKGLPF